MTHSGNTVSMYVFDVSIDFGLSGSTAQSSGTRSFFPRNLTQPSIHIAVQCPTQRHMAELAEFVRMTQKNMWEPVTLEIKQRNKTLYRNVGRRLKGTHSPIKATGYVKSIPREHNANEASPEVTFDFLVEQLLSPWVDELAPVRRLKTWHDIIEGVLKNDTNAGFVDDPDANVAPPAARGNLPGTTGNAPDGNGQVRPG
jgi:hypothetical protein